MATTRTDVYNMALALLGGNQVVLVQNPSESSNEAAYCELFYSSTLQELLEEHPWSFAVKTASLAKLPDSGTHTYPYRYGLPADCVTPLKLTDSFSDFSYNYIVRDSELWTNILPAYLEYVYALEDLSKVPANFLKALAYGLAKNIAMPARNDINMQQLMEAGYINALGKAKQKDRARSKPLQPIEPWVAALNGHGGY